ncbi:MAG: AEC family transporter [Lachnospiraceae bacterium]|nr:AEC family transporter [Lachnospiraceae bacterium]
MTLPVILTQMGVIIIFLAIGFFSRKKGFVNREQTRGMSWLVVNICGPLQCLSAIFNADALPGRTEMLKGLLIVFILYMLMVALGRVIGPIIRAEKSEWRFYNAMSVFGNVGFIGLPLCEAIIGPAALPYLILFNLVYNPLFYTYGYILLRKDNDTAVKFSFKEMMNPGFICSIIAIVVLFLEIRLPAVINDATLYSGNAVLFLSLFVIGTNLADTNFRAIITNKSHYLFILIRQMLFPIAMILILKNFIISDPIVLGALAIGLSVPVGNAPSMVAATNGCNMKTLTECTVFSTVLTVLTMTICLIVAM